MVPSHPQKIEVIDEDEEDDDYNVELMASDLEQMQSLLEFKVTRHWRASWSAFLSNMQIKYERLNEIPWNWQWLGVPLALPFTLIPCLSARGSAVLREWAREPKTKIPGACELHEEPAERCEKPWPGKTAGDTHAICLNTDAKPFRNDWCDMMMMMLLLLCLGACG